MFVIAYLMGTSLESNQGSGLAARLSWLCSKRSVLSHFGRVLVSTESDYSNPHAEDGSWPRKNYLPTTSNANIHSDEVTGEQFGMAMSLAQADEVLARFSETYELAA